MRSSVILPVVAALAFAAPLSLAAPPSTPASPTPARAASAPAQVRLQLTITRAEKESAASDAPSAAAPLAIGSPTLTTLDRGTATVSVTSRDLSYSISASPAVEQGEKAGGTVQVLWNVRFSGRSLPEGTNAVTTTGATRITPADSSETLLTELPITDAKTGRVSLFRITARATVTPTDASGPKVGPTPPAAPLAPPASPAPPS